MNRIEAAVIARAAKAARAGTVESRFWAKVTVGGPDECWPWTACTRRKDQEYGAFWLNGRHQPANRVAWEMKNGPMPEDLFACHSCDNPACCNPGHLFAGTTQANTADKVSKGRQVKGARVHTAKLSESQVAEIRAAKPAGTRAPIGLPGRLAAKYGVTRQYLSEIWSGKSWRQA